jgi:hypothetical protein
VDISFPGPPFDPLPCLCWEPPGPRSAAGAGKSPWPCPNTQGQPWAAQKVGSGVPVCSGACEAVLMLTVLQRSQWSCFPSCFPRERGLKPWPVTVGSAWAGQLHSTSAVTRSQNMAVRKHVPWVFILFPWDLHVVSFWL